MITHFKWGAMYAKFDGNDVVSVKPILLGDQLICPGDLIYQIGKKKRTMFQMKEGYYLKYVGKCEECLLFTSFPMGCDGDPWYYAFDYVDSKTLLVGCAKGCRDIIVDHLILKKGVS